MRAGWRRRHAKSWHASKSLLPGSGTAREVSTSPSSVRPRHIATNSVAPFSENAAIANTNSDTRKPRITFDMLEVNEYLMSGLAVSSIDKWFEGSVPSFQPADLGVPQAQDLASSVHLVRELLDKPDGVTWPPVSTDPTTQKSVGTDRTLARERVALALPRSIRVG